jgi:predicted DNA-binding transcriptional regulator AlpA
MKAFSTREAAKELGIDATTLSRYIAAKKVPEPKIVLLGRFRVHAWTEDEVEQIRKLLPKIANGRKTRYSKLREKQKTQPGAAVPHKQRSPKKKRMPKQKRPKAKS